MAILPRSAAQDWLQAVRAAGIAFMGFPFRSIHRRRLVASGQETRGPLQHQWLKRLRPAVFRQDLITLFDLLQQQKIKPLIAQRLPLAEARQAQELLGKGGVIGKIVLLCNGSSIASGAA